MWPVYNPEIEKRGEDNTVSCISIKPGKHKNHNMLEGSKLLLFVRRYMRIELQKKASLHVSLVEDLCDLAVMRKLRKDL